MQSKPRVSIVLGTYNGQKYLLEAIGSCLLQTYEDLELIVVDDASTDGTAEIVSAVNDPRLRYIKHETNRKLSAGLNTGFAASRGEYLTWISDDNQFSLHAIERMVQFLDENPDIGIVYTAYWIFDGDGKLSEYSIPEPPEMNEYYNVVGACFMYRRSVYEQVGDYNEELVYLLDNEYWLRVSRVCKMAPLNEVLYYYRLHKNTQTTEYQNAHGRYYLDIEAANLLEPKQRRYRLSWLYEKAAQHEYCNGQKLKSLKSLLLAIYYQPTKLLRGDIIVTLLKKTPKFFRHL